MFYQQSIIASPASRLRLRVSLHTNNHCHSVGVITAVPPEMAGVASALLQIAFQAGSTIALAIQAGLLTVYPGSIGNWDNVKVSFWFEVGWAGVWCVGFLVWYRPGKRARAGTGVADVGEGTVEEGKDCDGALNARRSDTTLSENGERKREVWDSPVV